MLSFYDGFDEAYPDILNLIGLWAKVEEAQAITIPSEPRKPAAYCRPLPRHMNFERDHLQALAAACDIHADEIPIILEAVFRFSDNALVVDAFKKLITAAKLCTDANEALAENRNREREREQEAADMLKSYLRAVADRKKEIKTKQQAVADAEAAHRKAWLKVVRDLETRFNAVGGNVKKLSEEDALLYARAKRGTKKGAPFAFLRNQKGEKCAQILSELKRDLGYKMRERGIKAILKQCKGEKDILALIQSMDHRSANDLFDAYVRRIAFVRGEDGYPAIDAYAVDGLVRFGLGLKLESAEGWQLCLERNQRAEIDRWRNPSAYGYFKLRDFDPYLGHYE